MPVGATVTWDPQRTAQTVHQPSYPEQQHAVPTKLSAVLSVPETNELPCSAEEIVDDGDVDLQSASVGCGCIAVEVPDDAHAPGPLRPSVPL